MEKSICCFEARPHSALCFRKTLKMQLENGAKNLVQSRAGPPTGGNTRNKEVNPFVMKAKNHQRVSHSFKSLYRVILKEVLFGIFIII